MKVYQIFYDEKSRRRCASGFLHWDNSGQPFHPFYENSVLEQLYKRKEDADYIGVTSWKYQIKTLNCIPPEALQALVEKQEYDIYLYLPMIDAMFRTSHHWKTEEARKSVAWGVAKKMDFPVNVFTSPWVFNYCNFWIMRNKVFREYMETWLLPVMEYFRTNANPNFLIKAKHTMYPGEPLICEALVGSFVGTGKYSYLQAFKEFHK